MSGDIRGSMVSCSCDLVSLYVFLTDGERLQLFMPNDECLDRARQIHDALDPKGMVLWLPSRENMMADSRWVFYSKTTQKLTHRFEVYRQSIIEGAPMDLDRVTYNEFQRRWEGEFSLADIVALSSGEGVAITLLCSDGSRGVDDISVLEISDMNEINYPFGGSRD